MKKYVVFNADDFGLSLGTNAAIETAHQNGILTSASLLTTTPGFNQAVLIAKRNPKLGIGIHLSLTWGKSILRKKYIPDLVDDDGYFYPSFIRLWLKSYKLNVQKQIQLELTAQFEKMRAARLSIDHVNSQHHVHMLPTIFPIVQTLTKTYQIPFLRIPNEPLFLSTQPFIPLTSSNCCKQMLMKLFSWRKSKRAHFFGLAYSSHMNMQTLRAIIPKVNNGITEILSHPGFFQLDKESRHFDWERRGIRSFMTQKNRNVEYEALVSEELKNIIKKYNITLTNFKKLEN